MMNLEPGANQRFGDGPGRSFSPPLDYAPVAPRRDFVQELTNAARENPVSAALIGMGVLWMFMGGNRSLIGGVGKVAGATFDAARGGAEMVGNAAQHVGSAAYHAAEGAGSAAWQVAGGIGSAVHQAADRVGSAFSSGAGMAADGVSNVGSRASEAGRNAGSAVSDTTSQAGSHASGAISSAYDSLGSATGRAREMLADTGSSLSAAARAAQERGYSLSRTVQRDLADVFERQPLMLGAVGIAIGAALAAALPSTDAENRVMGEASESLKEQAKKLAGEQFQTAKSMGSEVIREVAREAAVQGLTAAAASQAFGDVKEKFANVAETARDGVKNKLNQSGSPGSDPGQSRR